MKKVFAEYLILDRGEKKQKPTKLHESVRASGSSYFFPIRVLEFLLDFLKEAKGQLLWVDLVAKAEITNAKLNEVMKGMVA